MVRGCQKKIIYLKNTESEVFDEAYFVVSDKNPSVMKECDMVEEANRILSECISITEEKGKIGKIKTFLKEKIPTLVVGIIIGTVIVLLIK